MKNEAVARGEDMSVGRNADSAWISARGQERDRRFDIDDALDRGIIRSGHCSDRPQPLVIAVELRDIERDRARRDRVSIPMKELTVSADPHIVRRTSPDRRHVRRARLRPDFALAMQKTG